MTSIADKIRISLADYAPLDEFVTDERLTYIQTRLRGSEPDGVLLETRCLEHGWVGSAVISQKLTGDQFQAVVDRLQNRHAHQIAGAEFTWASSIA